MGIDAPDSGPGIDQALRTMTIMYWVSLASPVFFTLTMWGYGNSGADFLFPDSVLAQIGGGAGFALASVHALWARGFVGRLVFAQGIRRNESRLRTLTRVTQIQLAFTAVVPIYGRVLFIATGHFAIALPFEVAGQIALLRMKPSRETWDAIVSGSKDI
jgi:hypothetical protein